METNPITRQVFDFQKSALSSWFDILSIIQDQADLTGNTMLNQASWIPVIERQAILNWVRACKNEGDRYKAYVAEGLAALEKYFGQEKKAAPAKPEKTTVAEKKAEPVIETK